MPQFFFHLYDDLVTSDVEGLEFPDLEAAAAYAVTGARDMAAQEVKDGCVHLGHKIEITAEGGAVLRSIAFRDVFLVTE